MIQVVAIINHKGGVGKTTTAVNLAAALARREKRTLLIDLDSQGSASLAVGVKRAQLAPSSAELLFDEVSLDEAVRTTRPEYPDLITGSLRLAEAEKQLQDRAESDHRLRHKLEQLRQRYDVILVDCAPSLSILTTNALVAADAFIVPVTPTYLALEGVVGLSQVVRDVRQRMGRVAPILGVALTMVPLEPDETQQLIIKKLRRHYGGKVFNTPIHMSDALEQAPIRGTSVLDYAPESRGAREYDALSAEVSRRLKRYGAVYSFFE